MSVPTPTPDATPSPATAAPVPHAASATPAAPPVPPADVHAQFDVDGRIAWLTFNRPDARHAMTWTMYEALVQACDRVDADDQLRVLIIRSTGDKAFISVLVSDIRHSRVPRC